MTIEVKDLIDHSITLATERRQQTLSGQETADIKGGMRPNKLIPPTGIVIGVIIPRPEGLKDAADG